MSEFCSLEMPVADDPGKIRRLLHVVSVPFLQNVFGLFYKFLLHVFRTEHVIRRDAGLPTVDELENIKKIGVSEIDNEAGPQSTSFTFPHRTRSVAFLMFTVLSMYVGDFPPSSNVTGVRYAFAAW